MSDVSQVACHRDDAVEGKSWVFGTTTGANLTNTRLLCPDGINRYKLGDVMYPYKMRWRRFNDATRHAGIRRSRFVHLRRASLRESIDSYTNEQAA